MSNITSHDMILTRTSLRNLEKGRVTRREIEIDLIYRRQGGRQNDVSWILGPDEGPSFSNVVSESDREQEQGGNREKKSERRD